MPGIFRAFFISHQRRRQNLKDFLVELKFWIQLLSPLWTVALLVLIRPIKNYFINIYQKHVGSPVKTNESRLKALDKRIDNQEKEFELLKDGQKAMMHNMIFNNTKKILSKGTITPSELENLDELMDPYEAMGGNGTAKKLVEECRSLKTRIRKGRNESKLDSKTKE